MDNLQIKTMILRIGKWILWVLLIQFILINTSASFYAYKLTHFYDAKDTYQHPSDNIFIKTWKLFTGPRFKKSTITEFPTFPYETIHFKTADNDTIEAWYGKADSAKGTVILFHGISTNKSYLLSEAYEFRYWGYNVMLVDLRAHGNSTGHNCTIGLKECEEVTLAFDYVLKKNTGNIFLYGVSMGAVIITKAIADYGLLPSGIILEMPFGSLRNHLQSKARALGFPIEPFGFLVTLWISVEKGCNGFKHRTCRYVEKINCPVLMQYGAKDTYVMPEETDKIYSSIASGKKRLVIYLNAGHEFLLNNEPAKWREEVGGFLRESSQIKNKK